MTSFFFFLNLPALKLPCPWAVNDLKVTQRYLLCIQENKVTKLCWEFLGFVRDWISSWPKGIVFFPSFLVIEQFLQYNVILCWTLSGYSLYCCPPPKSGVRGQVQQGACSWHTKGTSAGRLFTDTRAVTLLHICTRTSTVTALCLPPRLKGLKLLRFTLSAEPTPACYSVYRRCSF